MKLQKIIETCSRSTSTKLRFRPKEWRGCGLWLAPIYDDKGIRIGFKLEVDKCEDYGQGFGEWDLEGYNPEDYHCDPLTCQH